MLPSSGANIRERHSDGNQGLPDTPACSGERNAIRPRLPCEVGALAWCNGGQTERAAPLARHWPTQLGLRFSWNAFCPSRASSVKVNSAIWLSVNDIDSSNAMVSIFFIV